jgi:hypothetical protein
LREFSENQFGFEHFEPNQEVGAKAVGPATKGHAAERRRHERYAVQGEAEVLLADGSQIFRGRILDISLSGCFIETQARLRMPVGTPVEMVFRANEVMLRAAATVRAIRRGAGAGFLFDDMSPRMQDELEMLIEALNLSKPNARVIVIPPGRRTG